MSLLDKFKRKPADAPVDAPQDDNHFQPVEVDDAPPELVELVQAPHVEPGIPQNLSLEGGKSVKRFVFLGVGLAAIGSAVAGLIAFTSGDSTQEAAATEAAQPKKAEGNTRPKDFQKDKEQIEKDRLLAEEAAKAAAASAASAPAASAASAPPAVQTATPATTPPPTVTTTQMDTGTSATASPVPAVNSVRQRRLGGDVLISTSGDNLLSGGGQSSSPSQQGAASPETEGKPADSGTSFASRLNPTLTAGVTAQQRGDLTYLLTKGTNIRCGLDTRIITTQPGIARCIVSNDVYSANGKVVLVERGSKITGEQTSALLQGQARVFVLWNEVETPAGVKVSLRSPGSGALGEAGQGAYVNYHFWQRFGGAMMISLINDIGANASNKSSSGNNNNITYENSSDNAQQMATEALKNSINIPPTGVINQGALLNIMVARDVNFKSVYDRVDTENPF